MLVYPSTGKKVQIFCFFPSAKTQHSLELNSQAHPIPLSDWSGLVWYIHLYLDRDEEQKKEAIVPTKYFRCFVFPSQEIF